MYYFKFVCHCGYDDYPMFYEIGKFTGMYCKN